MHDETSTFLTETTRDNHLTREKHVLNKLKHLEEPGRLLFYSNEKKFGQVTIANHRKIGEETMTDMCRKCIDDAGGL